MDAGWGSGRFFYKPEIHEGQALSTIQLSHGLWMARAQLEVGDGLVVPVQTGCDGTGVLKHKESVFFWGRLSSAAAPWCFHPEFNQVLARMPVPDFSKGHYKDKEEFYRERMKIHHSCVRHLMKVFNEKSQRQALRVHISIQIMASPVI
jgi:hypothetical protein